MVDSAGFLRIRIMARITKILSLIALTLSLASLALSLERRVTRVETHYEDILRALERIERKVDFIYERAR